MELALSDAAAWAEALPPAHHAVDGIEVISVSDVQEALVEKLATDLGTSYTLDYHELLADDRIRAVLIASPPFMHSQMAVDAANAGKHVFSRKADGTYIGCLRRR